MFQDSGTEAAWKEFACLLLWDKIVKVGGSDIEVVLFYL